MSNYLKNGGVLPSGLMDIKRQTFMSGFNKTYKNFPLRVGVIVAAYSVNDDNNYAKLTTEYDVDVVEQNEDMSITIIRYRNCMSSEGMGSLADYFEKNLRPQQTIGLNNTNPFNNQDGAIVLLLCLDGMSTKGIIVSSLTHPNRTTNLQTTAPYLEGEYNGVNIVIDNEGDVTLMVKGATDNGGTVLVPQPSPTTITISSVGAVTISAPQQSVNVNCLNANVIATETAVVDGTEVKLGAEAIESVIKGETFATYFDSHTHATVFGPSSPPIVPMPANTLSTKVFTE